MAYLVPAVAGDSLCSIARRHGYSNCGTVRSDPANAALLDRPLAVGDNVSIPQLRDGWVYPKIATGRRWTVRVVLPVAPPQAVQLRFVRKAAVAPAAAAPLPNIGISRLVTRSTGIAGNDDWVDHTHYDFDAASHGDPNTFGVEVNDPNETNPTVSVRLEALQPTYDHLGARNGWQRFAAGAERNRRTLVVTGGRPGALGAGLFWSPELRLVTHGTDHAARPRQTLLITDLFDGAGAGADIQILDQNVRATYEYARCPRAAGQKCVLAVTDLPLRRGNSVPIEVFILRAAADGTGTGNHNGLVSDQDVRRRINRNCRRIWAQEELSFDIHQLHTVDPPSDMLTVADPTGADAVGHIPGAPLVAGQVGFRVTNNVFGGGPVVNVVGPLAIAANNTPAQTAAVIVNALNLLPNIAAQAMPCAPQGAAAQGCIDIIIRCNNGIVTLDQLTAAAQQDAAQLIDIVHLDVTNVPINNYPRHYRTGGEPGRRLLFKAFATNPQRLSVFVVRQNRGGLTTGALDYLGGGHAVDAAVRNCLTMNDDAIDGNLDTNFAIFPHELGHALTDADHTGFTEASLMYMGPQILGQWSDNVRVTGPGYPNHDYDVLADAGYGAGHGAAWEVMPGVNPLGLLRVQTTAHDLIAANTSLLFNAR